MLRRSILVLAMIATASSALGQDRPATGAQTRALEIRSYNLKPGTRDRFHQLFLKEALPMLNRWKVDVVAYGASLHDADSYYLMRGFTSVADRQRSEDAFYGSEEWRKGPREAILACIDTYTTVVIAVDEDALAGLRKTMSSHSTTASDLDTLMSLNMDYVRSVQFSDVKRFEQILADDFQCSLPDGTLLDRAQFLAVTAKPVTISNLSVHDVKVRVMGDFAIIHARTMFTLPGGRDGSGRYTDVWARRNGQWVAVAAHVTRN